MKTLFLCFQHICRGLALLLLGMIPVMMFGQTNEPGDKEAQIAGWQTELDAAADKVKAIVNQPVAAYRRVPGMKVSVFSPGWFHAGASKPDFATVDIRQSQDLGFAKSKYVTSDLNPGLVFLGADLEFNGMTKYFYTNRNLPKKRLTEPEMVEINRLYRIIGDFQAKIYKVKYPVPPSTNVVFDSDTGDIEADAPLVRQPIPKSNYVKAAVGISAVLGVYVFYRLIAAQAKKKFSRR